MMASLQCLAGEEMGYSEQMYLRFSRSLWSVHSLRKGTKIVLGGCNVL